MRQRIDVGAGVHLAPRPAPGSGPCAPCLALNVTRMKSTLVWTMYSPMTFLTRLWWVIAMNSPHRNSATKARKFGRAQRVGQELNHGRPRSSGDRAQAEHDGQRGDGAVEADADLSQHDAERAARRVGDPGNLAAPSSSGTRRRRSGTARRRPRRRAARAPSPCRTSLHRPAFGAIDAEHEHGQDEGRRRGSRRPRSRRPASTGRRRRCRPRTAGPAGSAAGCTVCTIDAVVGLNHRLSAS